MKTNKRDMAVLKALLLNTNLTKSQVNYVKMLYEPKYDNNCINCRINVMLSLGVTIEDASKAARSQKFWTGIGFSGPK